MGEREGKSIPGKSLRRYKDDLMVGRNVLRTEK